jgi:hypothetical protein
MTSPSSLQSNWNELEAQRHERLRPQSWVSLLKFRFRVRAPYSTYILVEAGTQRYNVGIDTPKLWATSLGGVPEESNFLAALTLPSVIRLFRPPTRPCRFAASNRGPRTKRKIKHVDVRWCSLTFVVVRC